MATGAPRSFVNPGDETRWQTIFPGKFQKVSVSGASNASAALSNDSSGDLIVRLCCPETDVFVAVAASVTTSGTTGLFIPAGAIEYIGVKATGQTIAVIAADGASTGNLYLCEGV